MICIRACLQALIPGPTHGTYFFGDGAEPGAADAPGAELGAGALLPGGVTSAVFTAGGSLSALASRIAICHIWVSESDFEKPGMPLRRMPFAIFQ